MPTIAAPWARRLAYPALLPALAAMPWIASDFYLGFATLILIFSLFAMSLDLLVGYTGLVSLGHAAFFGIGAYATAILIELEVVQAVLVLPASVLLAALAAAAIGALSVRTAGVSFIMITLALAQLVYYVALNSPWTGSTDGMLMSQRPVVGLPGIDLEDSRQFYFYCLLWVGLSTVLMARLVRSPFGRALQGIRANEERMGAMGFRTVTYKLAVFVIAGAFAGLAGHLFVSLQFFIDPTSLQWSASGQVLMMVVLGGVGTLAGPAIGALVFHGLEDLISSYTQHWMLPMGLILVLVVLFGRGGLIGLWRRWQARRSARRAGRRDGGGRDDA